MGQSLLTDSYQLHLRHGSVLKLAKEDGERLLTGVEPSCIHDINPHSVIARAAMQSLVNQIMKATCLNFNEAEVVQRMHSAYLPIGVRLLGS